MVDEDFGLMFRSGGCTCSLHMKRFNELAGTNMIREDLINKINSGLTTEIIVLPEQDLQEKKSKVK